MSTSFVIEIAKSVDPKEVKKARINMTYGIYLIRRFFCPSYNSYTNHSPKETFRGSLKSSDIDPWIGTIRTGRMIIY